jgi:hypothetical protein
LGSLKALSEENLNVQENYLELTPAEGKRKKASLLRSNCQITMQTYKIHAGPRECSSWVEIISRPIKSCLVVDWVLL